MVSLIQVKGRGCACDTVVSAESEPQDLQRQSPHVLLYSTTAWINGPVASFLLNHLKPSSIKLECKESTCVGVFVCVQGGSALQEWVLMLTYFITVCPHYYTSVNIPLSQEVGGDFMSTWLWANRWKKKREINRVAENASTLLCDICLIVSFFSKALTGERQNWAIQGCVHSGTSVL